MAERVKMMNVIISQNDLKPDTANRDIKVLVLQASPASTEKIYYTVTFPAINTRDEPPIPPRHEPTKAPHKCNPPSNGILPDVRYNRTTLKGRWSEDAWAHRALYAVGDYHILHAPSSDDKGPVQNWFRPDLFQGDIFVLKVAVTSGRGGCGEAYVYDDLLLNAAPGAETALVEMLDRRMG
ncbi:hypothetical protein BDR22DRAFT_838270 [Usnea florida]